MPQPPITRPAPPPQDHDWQPGQGGSIAFGRLRLDIEPGTFTEPVRLQVRVPGAPPPIPEHLTLPFVFRVEARTTRGQLVRTLNRDMLFRIDFADMSPEEWGRTFANLYYFDEDTQRWTVVPAHTDMAARRVVAQVGHFTDFGFGGDANQQPSVHSNLEGYQVDLCSGYSRAGIGLKVPPGTAGLTPELSLRYNSGFIDKMNGHWIRDGNNTGNENTRTRLQASPIGFGWTLDLGAITRYNVQQDGDPWPFYLSLNGQTYELKYVDGTLYRSKPDEYLRIRKLTGGQNDHSEYWLIETKDGIKYRFGYRTDSEMRAARWNFGGTAKAWQWNLDQIKDTHGNIIDIEYTEVSTIPNNGDWSDPYDQAAYPSRITYTGNPGQGFTANREITFYYSDRTDHATHAGYTYTQYYWKKKLDRIEMRVGGTLVRTYEFTYDYKTPRWYPADTVTPQTQGLSKLVLISLKEKAADGSQLPVTTFSYHDGQIPGSSPAEYFNLQLNEADNGYGGKVTYDYRSYAPEDENTLTLRRQFRVTSKSVSTGLTAHGGVSSTIVHTYSYGPAYYVPWSWDYRGHSYVTVTDTAGHYEKSYFYTRDAVNGKTDTAEIERLQQRRYKLERWQTGAGAATMDEWSDWGWTETQGGTHATGFPRLDGIRRYQGSVNSKTRYEYDSYGNVYRTKEYDSAGAGDNDWWCSTRRWYFATVNSDHYIVGKQAREIVYKPGAGEGDWVRDTHYCYDGSYYWNHVIGDAGYGDDQSYRGRLTAVRRVLNGTYSADVTYAYDGYGNRISATDYEPYGTTEGNLPASGGRTTTVTYESAYHTFPNQITNPLGHVETRSYDARWGKPTQITDPNGGLTNFSYDVFGRLTSVQGPEVNGASGAYRRTTEYGYYGPSTANGRTTTQLHIKTRGDLGGTPAWFLTRRFYDGIGRVVQEYSDGFSGVNVVNSYYDGRGLKWKDAVAHAGTGTGSFLDSDWANYSGAATTYTNDELRRPRVTTLPDGKTTEVRYANWSSTVLDQNKHARQFDRDMRGRVTKITEFSGADPSLSPYAYTLYEYNVLDQLTKVTDHANNITTIGYDALGRKTSLSDPDMGTWLYEYDPIGTLKSQRDARSQYVYFYYDTLKRPVRKWYPVSWTQSSITTSSKPTVYDLMELRAALDVDRKAAGLSPASWTDTAIVAGTGVRVRAAHFTELRARIQDLWTAANMGNVPEFTGGSIVASTRKIKATDLTDLRGWLASYENSTYGQSKRARVYMEYDAYDGSSQFGRGKRTALWDGCGRQSVWWDKAGRMTKEERTLDGALYTTQWSYDARDRVYQLTYPDGEVLTHSYAANGLLSQITSSLGVTLVSGTQYNALNLPTLYTLGSGTTAQVQQTYYGPDATGWPYGALKTIQLQQGTNPRLVDRSMVYDPVGNVTGIADAVNGETITYSYDELDRLLSASAPSGETYTYNQIGNIATKNGLSFTYDASHKHAVSGYNGQTYSYDANGCLTSTAARDGQSIAYDPETRPVRVDSGATICRFAYDSDSVRRKRLDSKGTIHYVGPYERNVGNGIDSSEVVTKYYMASFGGLSRLIVFRRAGTLYWVGTDHLGSTIRVANSNFTALDGMRYRPFGISRDAGTNLQTDHKFTSQIEDQVIGLYWYNSRAYDAAIGRFVAPDTIVPEPKNPQSLNRYSYCLSNPVRYTDPTGHDVADWFGDDWVQAFQDAHGGADPTLDDYAWRYSSMAVASGMLVPSYGGEEVTFYDHNDDFFGVVGESSEPAEPFQYWAIDVGGDLISPWYVGATGGLMTLFQGPDVTGPKETYAHYGGGVGSPGGAAYVTVGKQMSPGGLSISGLTPVWPAPFLVGVGAAAAVTIDPVVLTDPSTWRLTGLQVGVGAGTVGGIIQYERATLLGRW